MTADILQIVDYRKAPPKPKRRRPTSQYARYRLPFFDRKRRLTWAVTPSGDYGADCNAGRAYAIKFLKSCDGTCGWASLLGKITADMICAGSSGTLPNGRPEINGVVIGFMSAIGEALAGAIAEHNHPKGA